MPIIDTQKIDLARSTVKKQKIFTLKKLVSLLDCSSRTAQAKLKLWEAYTSYNQNGKYYTLPEIPQFDIHGIWRFKTAAFSKHGNLKKTIVHLVNTSPDGLTGRQLGELLGLSPQSFLHHFRNCPGICREKHAGVYVYFSDNTPVFDNQVRKRKALINRSAMISISAPESIMILVAIIKHHGISAEDILNLPEIKKSKITKPAVQGFLEYHGLLKKIPDSLP
ncbi:MAG: hypothetical protein MI892_21075 [Desulfobacterales bacterium]|nr:hypothetical protein [Desulfobacterales bacterium]